MPAKTIKKTPMIEVDQTVHFEDRHDRPPRNHSKAWYAFWGNECPVCKAPADVNLEATS